jgi:hypothetical protein
MKRELRIDFKFVILAVVVLVLAITFIPLLSPVNELNSIPFLESRGYIVLASGEYSTLLAKVDANSVKLDDVKTTALVAVTNAEAAATTSDIILDKILLFNENISYLYPTSTVYDCTFTAGGTIDTFGDWAEIVDNTPVTPITLTSKFTTAGYLSEMTFREYSTPDKICIIEIAYGASKIQVAAVKVRADFTWVLALRSARIPTGQTIYYRMKSEEASETAKVDFRYYLE